MTTTGAEGDPDPSGAEARPASIAVPAALWGIGGSLAMLAYVNRWCHAHLYSFPLSWRHAEQFHFGELASYVGATVQWPYSALLVLSREGLGSYLPGAKGLSLAALLVTAWLVARTANRLAGTAVAALAVVLFYLRYVETALLPSHDGLHGVLACAALAALLAVERPRPGVAGTLMGLAAAVKVSAFALLPGLVAVALVRIAEQRTRALALLGVGFAAGAALVLVPNLVVEGTPLYSTQAAITWVNAHDHAGLALPAGEAPTAFAEAFLRDPRVMGGWWLSRFWTFVPLGLLALGRLAVKRDGLSAAIVVLLGPLLLLTPLADDDQRYRYPIAIVEALLWAEFLLAVARGIGPPIVKQGLRFVFGAMLLLMGDEAVTSTYGHTSFCLAARECGEDPQMLARGAQVGERLYRFTDPHIAPLPEIAPEAGCGADGSAPDHDYLWIDETWVDGRGVKGFDRSRHTVVESCGYDILTNRPRGLEVYACTDPVAIGESAITD